MELDTQEVEAQEAPKAGSTETTETTQTQEQETGIKDEKAVLAALDRAKNEAKTFREERDTLKARIEALEGDETVSLWKQKAINAYVKASLKEKGVADVNRVMKYLDLAGVDLDDSDALVGFDEKVQALQKDLPELFDKKRQVGSADIFADAHVQKPMTGTELQVSRLFGKR